MIAVTQRMIRFLKQEDGPTAVEYAAILALIVVVCVTAIGTLGQQTNGSLSTVSTKVKSVGR